MDCVKASDRVCGSVRAMRIDHAGRPHVITPWRRNTVMYDWTTIVAKLLSTGNSSYRINGMYLEYQNVAGAGDPVTPPAYGRDDGIAYYDGLSSSPDIDYLRVPLVAAAVSSSDAVKYPGGNAVTFFAQALASIGSGTHGKNFNDTAISKVYGGALVAIPDLGDRTQDLVFSRFYFDTADQQVKLASSQIGLEWMITLQ